MARTIADCNIELYEELVEIVDNSHADKELLLDALSAVCDYLLITGIELREVDSRLYDSFGVHLP